NRAGCATFRASCSGMNGFTPWHSPRSANFFNTCYSRDQAQAVVEHVAAAIRMNKSIGDDAAKVFAASFYSAIGFGHSIGRSFQQAKAALMLQGIPEESTPELFVAEGLDSDALVLVKPAH